MKIFKIVKMIPMYISAILMVVVSLPASAGLISDELWQIQYGDTLDSIVTIVAPTVKRSEADLRSIVQRLNPSAFEQDGRLIPGRILRIPGAKIAGLNIPGSAQANIPNQSNVPNKSLVGHVLIASGNLRATDSAGQSRSLERHSLIYEGDNVITSAAGHAQLRFTDGALIALRPDTEFKVESYRFVETEDGSEQGIFSLLKGGFRTITGLIGKKNKQNYRVNTAVATIGIRGTHYGLRLCDVGSCLDGDNIKPGLYGGVVDGSITVTNNTGDKIFNNDQYFHVVGNDISPRGIIAPPGVIFNGEELQLSKQEREQQAKQVKNNQEKAEALREARVAGSALVENVEKQIRTNKPGLDKPKFVSATDTRTIAPRGAVFSISTIGKGELDPVTGLPLLKPLTGALRADGTNEQFILLAPENLPEDFPVAARLDGANFDLGVARGRLTQLKDADFNRDYHISWGRWDTDYNVTANGVPVITKGSLHYIYSPKTSSIAALDTLGNLIGTVTYQGIDGTNPTDLMNNEGKLVSAYVTVDFLASNVTNYYVRTEHGGDSYEGHLDSRKGPVSIAALQFASKKLELQGTCSGGPLCSSTSMNLVGSASLIFLDKGDEIAQGAASTYVLVGADPGSNIGSTGSILFERP